MTAILLMWAVLWLTGVALDLPGWGLLAASIVTVVLSGNYLMTHGRKVWSQTLGRALWIIGLFWFLWGIAGGAFLPRPGSVGETNLIMLIGLTTVVISFLVGRRWGPFYGALSFLIVPSLSLFGLIVPVHYSVETVIGFIFGFVLGLFLATLESLLIRWQKGQVVEATPRWLLRYCWYLSLGGAAGTLTFALLLVPPATLIRAPVAERLFRLASLRPFAQYVNNQGVAFSETFSISGGAINLPDVVLFRVRGTQYHRWRVRSYAHYLGAGWRVSTPLERGTGRVRIEDSKTVLEPDTIPPGKTVRASVRTVAVVLTDIPIPGRLVRLEVPGHHPQALAVTTAGTVLLPSTSIPVTSYVVEAAPVPDDPLQVTQTETLDSYSRRVLTEFPSHLWRIQNLARAITAEYSDPFAKVKALESFLRSNYRYTDSPPVLPHDRTDAVSFFLFEAGAGACDWFASALALMCRSLGIPARVVTGFYATEPDPEDPDGLAILASDAHAWVEAFLHGIGWITLDATPGSMGSFRSPWLARWINWLSRQSRQYLTSPYSIWWTMAVLWLWALFPLVANGVLLSVRALLPKPAWRKVVATYLRAVERGQSIGMELDPSRTPYENATLCRHMPQFPMEGKQAFGRLTELVVQSLYADRDPTPQDLRDAREALRAFKRSVARYRSFYLRRKVDWSQLYRWLQRL